MPVQAPSDAQWADLIARFDLIAAAAEKANNFMVCDRIREGLPVGPPALLGPCPCDANGNPATVAVEGVAFECCLDLAAANLENQVGAPDCWAADPDVVTPPEVAGLPEGLSLEFDSETEGCPKTLGRMCIRGTPAAGTGSPAGVVYRYVVRVENCFGADSLACSLVVKRPKEACDP